MMPYDEIIENADRTWTARLVARLDAPDVDDEELRSLRRALQAVSDSRSFAALREILLDSSRPERIRTAAGAVLRGMDHVCWDEPPEILRQWWEQGDETLRRAALQQMGGLECPDILRAVASDDSHPWQADALERMEHWFDTAPDEAIKIRALSHPDEWVRQTAAWVLLWDEPVAAEELLIHATADPSSLVARQAIRSLWYYPSTRVLRLLHDLRSHPDGKFRDDADEGFNEISVSIQGALQRGSPTVIAHLRAWLAPVWDILDFTDEDLEPDPPYTPRPRPTPPLMPVKTLLEMLADLDTSPRRLSDTLYTVDWTTYTGTARSRLRRVILAHPDELVRQCAAWALAAWGDAPGLLQLLGDPSFGVRKSTMFHLASLPASTEIADVVWAHFQRRGCLGVHGTEALRTFVHHADPVVAVKCLAPLAENHDEYECLRLAAIRHLTDLGAVEPLSRLLPELADPPGVTWVVHIALLAAIRRLVLPAPDVRHLGEVDNLYLQVAVVDILGV
jgi:HEAT repeat protein